MSSLLSKDDKKMDLKDQIQTNDHGSTEDSKPETIWSKIVLFQPAIQEQTVEASGTINEDEESKDLSPTIEKSELGTSKAKDEVIPEANAYQPGTSNQSSSIKREPDAKGLKSSLGLRIPLKRTRSQLKNMWTRTANVGAEQVDSGRRYPIKKKRIALFMDLEHKAEE